MSPHPPRPQQPHTHTPRHGHGRVERANGAVWSGEWHTAWEGQWVSGEPSGHCDEFVERSDSGASAPPISTCSEQEMSMRR